MMDDDRDSRKRKRESTGNEGKDDRAIRWLQEQAPAANDFVPERPSPLVGLRMPSEMSHPSTVMGQVAPDLEALRHSQAMMQMQQMNMTNAMQTSLQRQGAVNPSSLFSSGLATGGTGGLSDQGLADGSLARSQLFQSQPFGQTAITHPATLPTIAQPNPYLPAYDQRNFAAPSFLRGLQDLQNPMQPTHALGQISAQHRQQSATAQRQYTDEALRMASASSFLVGQLTASLPNESIASRHASLHQQLQPPSSPASVAHQKTRAPITLYLKCDNDSLTPYQCLARQQIQLFEASPTDADAGTQGRNRNIVIGQVGIRCKHCGHLPLRERARGSTYYPSKLTGIYQAAQNMANSHLAQYCREVPKDTRDELKSLGNKKSSAGGGKGYWSGGAKILGVVEDEHGLRFGH